MAGPIPPEPGARGVALIADRRGRAGRHVVERGLAALHRLSRAAAPAAPAAASAGLLLSIPWDLAIDRLPEALRDEAAPRVAAMLALEPTEADRALAAARSAFARHGWFVLGWREVPVRFESVPPEARATMPRFVQCFARGPRGRQRRTAYRLRLEIETRWARLRLRGCRVPSLSHSTMVYKAITGTSSLSDVYPDLIDPRVSSPFAVLHFDARLRPSARWEDAQPFHDLAHDGEIRTIEGNRRWLDARVRDAGDRTGTPLVPEGAGGTQTLDAAVQWLRHSGLTTSQALARLLPRWMPGDDRTPTDVRTFLRHESCFAEPWEGTGAVAFADGTLAGAMELGGGQPLHLLATSEMLCVGSHLEALEPAGGPDVERTRLQRGDMVILDSSTGAISRGAAAWHAFAAQRDYAADVERIVHRLEGRIASRRAARDRSPAPSLRTLLGRRGQWMSQALPPVLLELDSAVLSEAELEAVLTQPAVRAAVLPLGYDPGGERRSEHQLDQALADLGAAAAALVTNGARILVLSHRRLTPRCTRIPSAAATAAVDRTLQAAGLRLRASIVIDGDDVADAHDAAFLSSLGAAAVVPRFAGANGVEAERSREAFESRLAEILTATGVRSYEALNGSGLIPGAPAGAPGEAPTPVAIAST